MKSNPDVVTFLDAVHPNTTVLYIWHETIKDPAIKILLRYFFPPFIILGIIGNGVCFLSIVARRLYRNSPVFMFYMFLSMSDFIEVSCEFLYILEDYLVIGMHSKYDIACKVVIWFNHSAMFSSSWLLVSVTAFRLYGIARPLDMLKRDGTKLSLAICVTIVSVISTLTIHVFWTNGVVVTVLSPWEKMTMCFVPDRNIALHYATAMLLFYTLGPGSILIILSIGIIISFVISYRRHKRLLKAESGKSKQTSNTYITAKNSVAMLIPLAMLQISTTFPLFIYIQLFGFVKTYPAVYFAFNRLRCANHSLNFYIQSIVSQFYRDAMLPCFSRKKKETHKETHRDK